MILQHPWVLTWQAIWQLIPKEFDQGAMVTVVLQDNTNTTVISFLNSVVESGKNIPLYYTHIYHRYKKKTTNVWNDYSHSCTKWVLIRNNSSSSYLFQWFSYLIRNGALILPNYKYSLHLLNIQFMSHVEKISSLGFFSKIKNRTTTRRNSLSFVEFGEWL